MANIKKKQTREERLQKKREAERLRYQRLKNDVIKNAELKEKERQKYWRKKEKGQVKSVKDMTPRQQRTIRKIWREKTRKRRIRLRMQNSLNVVTPPTTDDEEQQRPRQQGEDKRTLAARTKALRQRKKRNKLIKHQKQEIKMLREKVKTYKKAIKRCDKNMRKIMLTPNSKLESLISDAKSNKVEEVKKTLLFGEVMTKQLKENLTKISNDQENTIFRKVISGNIAKKYNVLTQINVKPISQPRDKRRSLLNVARKTRSDRIRSKINNIVINFLEEDCNSRLCPGKRDCITKKKIKKQKRYLLDTMKNLFRKFLKTKKIKISYTLFCQLRPFWVIPPTIDKRETCLCITHTNIDLLLASLNQAKIIAISNHQSLLNHLCCDRYNQLCLSRECQQCQTKSLLYEEFDNSILIKYHTWQSVVEKIEDFKTKRVRKVRKYTKKTFSAAPRDIILQLESDLGAFLKHEFTIAHQYQTLKVLKQNLTENDCLIHMDFSENFNTKYSEEIQSFHFGGSRTQISLHTVVVYTNCKTECFATMSTDLSHNVPAIWAHLEPILKLLPHEIENINFLSDGPVNQYRNKDMFYYLTRQLIAAHPNILNFTWNYHEAGHGKGAPDGVGGTCKRTAVKLVSTGTDIPNLEAFSNAIEKNCPGIKTFVIFAADIASKKIIFDSQKSQLKPFVGTLKVHQVRGSALAPYKLSMKSLSCFCDTDACTHFDLGTITYENVEKENHLSIADVYHSDSDSKPGASHPTRSGDLYKSGDYFLIKFPQKKTEYRYVGVCSQVDDAEEEMLITFLKVCNENATLFKVDETDDSHVPYNQICDKLPQPSLVLQGDRVYYSFKEPVNVFEQ